MRCLLGQVVAAAAHSAHARMALFAQINSASAVVIAALQLAATGRLIRRLGLAPALALSPAVSAALMAAIALAPTPFTVASGEVLRKASCPLHSHCPPSIPCKFVCKDPLQDCGDQGIHAAHWWASAENLERCCM